MKEINFSIILLVLSSLSLIDGYKIPTLSVSSIDISTRTIQFKGTKRITKGYKSFIKARKSFVHGPFLRMSTDIANIAIDTGLIEIRLDRSIAVNSTLFYKHLQVRSRQLYMIKSHLCGMKNSSKVVVNLDIFITAH